ncbi:MAG: flagellar biosynthesis protein FlhB [Pseudooceanicola sp.]|nr:flagellar biosynthesis protein FlhB [Pseudooceanicola sp.]|tara:strand:- start:3099 stop:4226 length:1128 start_codon:yes stop_codon:yes gene_type:complete
MAEQQEDQSSKNEEPTPQKLKKAREKGDVPSSREVGTAMTVVSLLGLTALLAPGLMGPLGDVLGRSFANAGTAQIGEGIAGVRDIGGLLWSLGLSLGVVLLPVAAVMVGGALVGVALQGETVVSAERIRPKLSKLSPLAGFKRLFSGDSFLEFLKSVAKVLAVGALAVWLTYRAVTGLWQTKGVMPEFLLPHVQDYVTMLLGFVAILMVALALFDVIYKRMAWMRKQRMSVKELRDEFKDQEGDPLIKGKRMEIRRQRARQRMGAAVSDATVVLTNPTHFAVALKYDASKHSAPVCVAKGADLMAAHIRRLARENDVPVIENRPLARALYDVAKVDQVIPGEHWQAVAGIIRYILDTGRNIRATLPEGSSLREDD